MSIQTRSQTRERFLSLYDQVMGDQDILEQILLHLEPHDLFRSFRVDRRIEDLFEVSEPLRRKYCLWDIGPDEGSFWISVRNTGPRPQPNDHNAKMFVPENSLEDFATTPRVKRIVTYLNPLLYNKAFERGTDWDPDLLEWTDNAACRTADQMPLMGGEWNLAFRYSMPLRYEPTTPLWHGCYLCTPPATSVQISIFFSFQYVQVGRRRLETPPGVESECMQATWDINNSYGVTIGNVLTAVRFRRPETPWADTTPAWGRTFTTISEWTRHAERHFRDTHRRARKVVPVIRGLQVLGSVAGGSSCIGIDAIVIPIDEEYADMRNQGYVNQQY